MGKQDFTLRLDDEVARWIRMQALRRNTSVSQLVEDVLRKRMLRERGVLAARRRFPTTGSRPREIGPKRRPEPEGGDSHARLDIDVD